MEPIGKKRMGEITLQQIAGTKKYQNGIQVNWTDGGKGLSDFFPYEGLIDMKVNASDVFLKIQKYTGLIQKTTGLDLRFNVSGR